MSTIQINGIEMHYEVVGDGPPLVLVHGNWTDSDSWQLMRPLLAESFRVITYDRRGHSRTERPDGPWTRRDNEDDLAALIEALDLGPAHVGANSYGGMITLGLATRRPELLRSISVHEPPAVPIATAGAAAEGTAVALATCDRVIAEIEAGATEPATRRFVEEVALGPGGWEFLPPDTRAVFVSNAPAFAVEFGDPEFNNVGVEKLVRFPGPMMVTRGDSSPPWLIQQAERIAELTPGIEAATIAGAGHAPNLTHAHESAALLRELAHRELQVSI